MSSKVVGHLEQSSATLAQGLSNCQWEGPLLAASNSVFSYPGRSPKASVVGVVAIIYGTMGKTADADEQRIMWDVLRMLAPLTHEIWLPNSNDAIFRCLELSWIICFSGICGIQSYPTSSREFCVTIPNARISFWELVGGVLGEDSRAKGF